MENLSDIKKFHNEVQNNIFNILVDYRVLDHLACTFPSKASLYYFSDEYKHLGLLPLEATPFINSVTRLFETNFLNIVLDPSNTSIYFIKTEEYNLFTEIEKAYFTNISEKKFLDIFQKVGKPSFSGGTV